MNFELGSTPAHSCSSRWFTQRRSHKSGYVDALFNSEDLLTPCLDVHPPLIR